jgi:xylose isomerase
VKVREMMDGITQGFIDRAQKAFNSGAEKDEMLAMMKDYPTNTLSSLPQDHFFKRASNFDETMKQAFTDEANRELQELIAGGKSEEKALKIAEKHLKIRQTKFIEYILNAEYSMYEKIHEKMKPAMSALEEMEAFAYNDGPKPFPPLTKSVDEFMMAYNQLLMDYSVIQAGSSPFPTMKIDEADEHKMKCKPVA